MKGKNFIVSYQVYPFDVLVSISQSDDEVVRILKGLGVDVDLECIRLKGIGKCTMLESGKTIIRLKHYPNTPVGKSTLAHEVYHAVCFLMDHIGMRMSSDSEEAYAYLIGYLTEKIYEKLKR